MKRLAQHMFRKAEFSDERPLFVEQSLQWIFLCFMLYRFKSIFYHKKIFLAIKPQPELVLKF